MIDNKTIREVIIADKLFPGGSGEPTYDTRTARGAIATFNTNVVKLLRSLTAQIVPKQEGTGDPSPSNPRPISGTSVLNVTRAGKNLFNGTNVLQMYLTSTKVLANTAARLIYIECKPNTTYTISKTAGARFSAGYTTEMPANNVDVYAGTQTDVTSSHITILTGADAKYLVSYVYNSNVDTITDEEMIASCQIELGSTATTYEPYTGSTYTIALGRTVYGGSAEVVEGTGKITFNEPLKLSSGWIYQGAGVDGGAIFYHTTSDKKANAIGFCEKLEAISSGGWSTTRKGTIHFGHSTGLIFVSIDGLTTSTDVNAFMSDCKFCYEVATPTEYTFTGQEINSLKGVNNIWHDTGDTEVSYLYQTGESGSKVNKWLPIFYPIRKGDT